MNDSKTFVMLTKLDTLQKIVDDDNYKTLLLVRETINDVVVHVNEEMTKIERAKALLRGDTLRIEVSGLVKTAIRSPFNALQDEFSKRVSDDRILVRLENEAPQNKGSVVGTVVVWVEKKKQQPVADLGVECSS